METKNHLVADDIIVGEGVALDVPPAGAFIRITSGLIDGFIYFASLIATLTTLMNYRLLSNGAINRIIFIGTLVTFMVLIPTLIETFSNGKSVGRLIMGTRVVRNDHGPIAFRHAFTRAMIGVIELWMTGGALAAVSILFSKKGLRIGDFAAGTLVVKERIPLPQAVPIMMPSQLMQWAQGADIGSIPTATALSARQFLHRKTNLTQKARTEMSLQLAQQLQEYVYPLPTPTPHPEDFIAAVLAERSRRAQIRTENNQKLAQTLLRQ